MRFLKYRYRLEEWFERKVLRLPELKPEYLTPAYDKDGAIYGWVSNYTLEDNANYSRHVSWRVAKSLARSHGLLYAWRYWRGCDH